MSVIILLTGPKVLHTDEIWVSGGGLKLTHTSNTRGPPGVWNCNPDDLKSSFLKRGCETTLQTPSGPLNPPLDTNMAKLAICMKDFNLKWLERQLTCHKI